MMHIQRLELLHLVRLTLIYFNNKFNWSNVLSDSSFGWIEKLSYYLLIAADAALIKLCLEIDVLVWKDSNNIYFTPLNENFFYSNVLLDSETDSLFGWIEKLCLNENMRTKHELFFYSNVLFLDE